MIRQWPLVGRTEELQLIARATRAAGERARGIVLSGPAGVGKTRLAREAVAACGQRAARRHWIVGTTSAQTVPLGAFADIATNFGPDPLRRVREVIDALIGDGQHGEVVVGLDDAHLVDELSAFAVHQLVARRLATVILTVRSGESPPDAITAIWKDLYLERLELQPLSLEETTELVEEVLDGPVQSLTARRLWRLTQGNVLYLSHLVESEVSAGRMARHSGVWLWEGHPTLSPTLAELLEARIARVPKPVRDVLDALAVAEPLDSEVLEAVTDPDVVADAESLGLIRVDFRARPATVRLAHPMLGEVRRTESLRLRRLRGRIATELARKGDTDARNLVRRAVLTIESDLEPDPELLLDATRAAMQFLDVGLAESLAQRAAAADHRPEAEIASAISLITQGRATKAETILGELVDRTSGPLRTQIALLRVLNWVANLRHVVSAETELDKALRADDKAAEGIAAAIRAWIDVVRGDPRSAVDRAGPLRASPPTNDVAHMLSIWALVTGLGDLGRIDEVESAADSGYRLADCSAEVSPLRMRLALLEANAYRLAGALTHSEATVTRVWRDTLDAPFGENWLGFLGGMSAMSRGALAEAQRLLREALAYLGTGDGRLVLMAIGRSWLTTVMGMAGRGTDARRELVAVDWSAVDPDACMWDSLTAIAEAWACAAEGATSQAISITRSAADKECERGRHAWEVCLLQTATQFGDATAAARLAELTDVVQGPRAPAAAAHAAALAAGCGDALVEASRKYETFGDRIAAADAAAHAVIAYQDAGLHGAALSASATAQRLANECGAQTPALRTATMPQPFTARQREVISLAAQGLSNKDIANRLTVSVRSVEAHLYRASQKVGANSRDQLIAILEGR